jgi:membrane-associated phospholipid phosphatase
MDWLASLDIALFRFINLTLSNPFFDWLFPFLSWNSLFVPVVLLVAIGLIWKGGARGRIFLLVIVVVTALGDGVICNFLKHAIDRPRPFHVVPEAHVLVGRGGSASMPSAHAANWFAGATIAFLYYRRSLWLMLPLAGTVAFSRVYLGVHYLSDVLAGALIGVAYAVAFARALNLLWNFAGQRWFPHWWTKLPSLFMATKTGDSPAPSPPSVFTGNPSTIDQHWLRLGYVIIIVQFLARLGYLASGTIELSEDEAYQWVWSKHLALSYFSKPPFIAYTQFLGTALWGDTEFGVRFFSAVIAALLGLFVLRFLAREINARIAFWLLLVIAATPLLAVGTTLMTIDPLSVLFWTAALLSGWHAVQHDSTRHWIWTGLWMGFGFLSKYTALFQLLCWAFFFLLWKPARIQLRRPGPYLALLVTALCTIPVLVWNQQNNWITVTHLAARGGLNRQWHPSLRFFGDFVFSETFLLNPVFFVATGWAAIAVARSPRRDALLTYLLSMGAPLFIFYLLYTFRARVQPNWIAPSVLPLFILAAIYWENRWRQGLRAIRTWAIIGITFGLIIVAVLHDTDLIQKITGRALPASLDPLRRVRGWRGVANAVAEERERLLQEGKPVFVIGDHYGITGLLSFYLPEAKASVTHQPLVYYQSSQQPDNQFYFWPSYGTRKGENAVYVAESERPGSAPKELLQEFESVTDLGMREILYRGRVFHKIQIFQCRNLR